MPKHFRNFICLALSMNLLKCSHHSEQQELETTLEKLQCEGVLKKDPLRNWTEAIVQSSETIGKNVLAYTYIASNYTAEVLWDTTAGVVLFVGLCGPIIAATAATRGGPFIGTTPINPGRTESVDSIGCLPASKNIKGFFAPPLGRRAVERTQSYRCPDTTPLFSALEKLISCYQKRNDGESLQKALRTLDNLESSEAFYKCLSPQQQLSLQNTRSDLQKRSAQINGA